MAITTRKRKRKHDGDVESKSRIDDLNDTLLELIFTRLSLWSDLATCKCVSKRWKSMISNPDFTPQLLPQSYAFTLVESQGECPLTLVSIVNVSHRNNHGFRIVHVLPGDPKSSTVQIYSSETGQWKTYYLLDGFDSILKPAITWKNKIHWMKNSIFKPAIIVIDPFNMDNLAPRVVNLPTGIGNYAGMLGVCQNHLRIAQFENALFPGPPHHIMLPRPKQRIKVWEIDDNEDVNNLGTNYVAKLVIDFKCTRSLLECPEIKPYDYGDILCCHPNDPQVIYFYHQRSLFYLNVVEQKCKKVDHSDIAWMDYSFVLVHPK